MMGQMSKQILTIGRRYRHFLALVVVVVLGCTQVNAVGVSTGIVTDPLTGVAIYGYDPVSYFTQEVPLKGRPEFEFEWGGVVWMFASAANRDVFLRHPEIYAPQFGGYGLMALSRGYLSEGNPRIYAILAGRLFLFYSTSNRDAFLLSQRKAYSNAAINWKRLSANLVSS